MYATWIGIAAYIITTLVVAWHFGRARQSETYLIADRSLGTVSTVMTIVASKIGAGMVISYLAYVYNWGPVAVAYFIGNALGYLSFIPFGRYLKQVADQSRLYTLPGLYRKKFGRFTGNITAWTQLFGMLVAVLLQLVGGAHVLSYTGIVSYNVAVVIIAAFVLAYLLLGGFKSVVATDFVQALCLFLLLPIFLWLGLKAIPSVNLIDFHSASEGLKQLPNFLIIGIVLPFATPELWQRVYAIKDAALVGRTLWTTAILFTLFGFVLTFIGLVLRVIVHPEKPELLLLAGFHEILPPAIAGLGSVFLLAAVMSSFDTYVYTAASILQQDILAPSGKGHAENLAVRRLKIIQVLLVGLAMVSAMAFSDMIDIALLSLVPFTVMGVTGIALALRREKLSSPAPALLLGLIFAFYSLALSGITPALVSYSAVGALIGLGVSWILKLQQRPQASLP